MASKFVSRSIKNFSSLNRAIASTLTHSKPSFAPIFSFKKNFSATTYFAQQSSNNTLKDLNTFLKEEIQAEKGLQKQLPAISGFDVKTDGPNVTFSRKYKDEDITVKFNVVNSIMEDQTEDSGELEPKAETEPPAAIKSRPGFTVDIKKTNKVLSFECSFLPSEYSDPKGAPTTEDFNIDAFAIHSGDWNENVYTADATVIDGNLYDILLNVLDERGIGEAFAGQLVDFSTAYEHQLYIGLLEDLSSFAK